MSIEAVGAGIAIAGLVIAGGLMVWVTDRFSRDRMMRCPETGAITVVRVAVGEGKEPAVQCCDAWPARKHCSQGCLARYSESGPGWRVNLDALRPFEPK